MSDQNKATARRFYEAWTSGDLDAYDEILASDAKDHDTQPERRDTRPGRRTAHRGDVPRRVLGLTLRDRGAVRRGRLRDHTLDRPWHNDGEMMGMPATGKTVAVGGITIDRFEDGKVVEGWTNWDTLGMMQQLAVVPQPAHV
jgi:ketosteroid isomerase-like protein